MKILFVRNGLASLEFCPFQIHVIEAGDIRREKGTYTREKNHLVLKKYFDNGPDGMVRIKPEFREKFKVDEIRFLDIFDGPEPVFEITKRGKAVSQPFAHTAKKKVDDSKKKQQARACFNLSKSQLYQMI